MRTRAKNENENKDSRGYGGKCTNPRCKNAKNPRSKSPPLQSHSVPCSSSLLFHFLFFFLLLFSSASTFHCYYGTSFSSTDSQFQIQIQIQIQIRIPQYTHASTAVGPNRRKKKIFSNLLRPFVCLMPFRSEYSKYTEPTASNITIATPSPIGFRLF